MKKKFNQDNWKKFKIGTYFEVKSTKTTKKEDISPGKFVYITTKNTFNGWESSAHDYSEEGKVITIDSATNGASFYQEKNFVASDHVEKIWLKGKKLNHHIAFFLIAILNFNQKKYSYGRKRNLSEIRKEELLLPADAQGNPDWQWMEDYVKEAFGEVKEEIIKVLDVNIQRERERESKKLGLILINDKKFQLVITFRFRKPKLLEEKISNQESLSISKPKIPLMVMKVQQMTELRRVKW